MRAPLVLFCNNNGWAISTPVEAQTRAETLADKAVGYGIPGIRVDGLDVLAVHEAAREAVERARECVGQYETFLRRIGVLDDERSESVRKEAEDLVRAGITAAEAEAPPDPELLFTHAYVDPPPNLRHG